jgi:effector-binding domain-containing protein
MPSVPYEVREMIVTPRQVAGVRARVPRGRVGQEFGRYLDQVYAAARAGAVTLDGQNVFIYRAAAADQLTVDFCVGVTAPFGGAGAVQPLETPGGAAAVTTHHGDYGRLGDANAAILAWCGANGRVPAGPSWEVYGHWHADPAQLRTDVYYLLQPACSDAASSRGDRARSAGHG